MSFRDVSNVHYEIMVSVTMLMCRGFRRNLFRRFWLRGAL